MRLWIAIVIGAAALTGHLLLRPTRGQSLAGSLQSPTAPRGHAEFQAELARLEASGLKLTEALETSLDGARNHLAGVFQRERPKDPRESFEFRIIEADNGVSKTIFRRTEFFFSFPKATDISKLNGADINRDGLKEIIVQSSSGGNCWSCNPAEIYQVRDHAARLIAACPLQRIADLNGDGVAELLVTDTRWEVYEDLSHAAAPSATMVYAWQAAAGGRYVYASGDFADFYKSEADRLRGLVAEAKAEITADEFSDEAYIGRAISLAITLAHSGDADRGVREMEALLNAAQRSPEQARKRARIIEDFRRGESSKRLREMKPGDPMQL